MGTWFGPDVRDRLNKQGRLLEVSKKRTEGVALRNSGLRKLPPAALEVWLPAAERWEQDAGVVVSKFSETEGERLMTLDVFPVIGVKGATIPGMSTCIRN